MVGLARNALNNLLAAVLPALVMLVTVPVLMHGLGEAQYGLLILLSSVTGYLAVLDLNVTAGSIKFLAEARAQSRHDRAAEVVSFGAAIYGVIGLLGAVLILIFADRLVGWLVDPVLYPHDQAALVLRVTALGFAFGQAYAFLLSVPQALQRYDVSGRVEIVNGALVPLATAGIVTLGAGLLGVSWLRNAASLLAVIVLVMLIRRLIPGLRLRWPPAALRAELLRFSGFAYLNRLAALSYQNSDKIVIAAVLDVRQVALYTVPVLLANRIMGTTYRLTQVIFPAASTLLAQGREDEVRRLMVVSMRLVFALNAMAVVGVLILADWFLAHWLGPQFAKSGGLILVLVTVGSLVDSLTNAPALITDSAGKPRVTGLFAVSRAAVGLLALYIGAIAHGIVGVAASHLLVSCVFTTLFLMYFARKVLPMPLLAVLRGSLLPGVAVAAAGIASGGLLALAVPSMPGLRLAQLALAGIVMLSLCWPLVLTPELRLRVRGRLGWGPRP